MNEQIVEIFAAHSRLTLVMIYGEHHRDKSHFYPNNLIIDYLDFQYVYYFAIGVLFHYISFRL